MLKITIGHDSDSHTVVQLEGELSTTTVESFNEEVSKFELKEGSLITLDFNNLEFISSAGLRGLLLLQKNSAPAGVKVEIAGMKPDIRQIFDISGFTEIFGLE